MLHDHSTPGLRDLSTENRLKIVAELHAEDDAQRTPSPRADEDATGTRMSGPFGRFDEDLKGTRVSGPMFRELGADDAAKIARELAGDGEGAAQDAGRLDEDGSGTRVSGPIGAPRFDEDATGTRTLGPMFRDLDPENAAKIAAELNAPAADDAAATRFDEDAAGTRFVGPVGFARLDEDATGTRAAGPIG